MTTCWAIYAGGQWSRPSGTGRGRTLSRTLLYWMQTDAPRPDGGNGLARFAAPR